MGRPGLKILPRGQRRMSCLASRCHSDHDWPQASDSDGAGYAYGKVYGDLEQRGIDPVNPATAEPIRSAVPLRRFRYVISRLSWWPKWATWLTLALVALWIWRALPTPRPRWIYARPRRRARG